MNADQNHEDTLSDYEPVEPASLDETTELIEYFKKQVNREALRENLKLTPAERLEKFERLAREKYPDRSTPAPGSVPVQPLHESAALYSIGNPNNDRRSNAPSDLVEAFKKDIDRTLLIENLKLTPAQRIEKFLGFMEMVYEVREAGRRSREGRKNDIPERTDLKRLLPKDLLAAGELEALLEERNKSKGQ
ncbi:MAG TPA: hypothetical protein VK615_11935 [Candidatus Binatia bacterium]|nr:hypothetical protein [Candidatus Binatia bacterium]